MRAKPILDILVGTRDAVRSRACIAPLEAKLGYVCLGDHVVPGECFFFRGDPRTHHLHLAVSGGPVWCAKIAFRDMLLADRSMAGAYETEKLKLAARFPNDRDSYTRAKTAFIERVTGAVPQSTPVIRGATTGPAVSAAKRHAADDPSGRAVCRVAR